jgi:hypothetical protein
MRTFNADVAELVDAQRSGRCGSNLVEVRVLSSALLSFFHLSLQSFTNSVNFLVSVKLKE